MKNKTDKTKLKYAMSHYAQPCLIKYYEYLKLTNRVSELLNFLGYQNTASLSNIVAMRSPLPLETAIKIVAFSEGVLYLGDLCPYIKEYLPIIARQQIRREQEERKNHARRNYQSPSSGYEQND